MRRIFAGRRKKEETGPKAATNAEPAKTQVSARNSAEPERGRISQRYPRPQRMIGKFYMESPLRTKKYGLSVLERILRGRKDASLLPYRIYQNSGEFSIRDFENPSEGRLIVRSDLRTLGDKMPFLNWHEAPRLNIDLWKHNPKEVEANVRGFMDNNRTSRFIVHKAPMLSEYERHFWLSVDCEHEFAKIRQEKIEKNPNYSGIDGYYFESEEEAEMVFRIDPKTGEWKLHDQETYSTEIDPGILETMKSIAKQVSEHAARHQEAGEKTSGCAQSLTGTRQKSRSSTT